MEETLANSRYHESQNENEAERLMNDSPYGLTASIWTSDKDFASQFGNRIQTGTFF